MIGASVEFYSALLRAGTPAEMHLFRHGAHGSGLGKGDASLDLWRDLLEAWLRAQGWLTSEHATAEGGNKSNGARPRARHLAYVLRCKTWKRFWKGSGPIVGPFESV